MPWKDYEVAAMRRALKLAARGLGAVEPNPMVGAVVVRDGAAIAEGYHRRFGGPHAEVEALRVAGDAARGAEVFVTLEPCSHFGKTPPCADALVAAGVSRVVAAMEDPFERVRGRGLARLREAGIAVETGLLEDEARGLNAPFIKLRTKRLPWVIAKYAMTADGRIATKSGESRWISCESSRRLVHTVRSRVDAVLVGVQTALTDDPLLTARPKGKRVATRIVLDSQARLPLDSALLRSVDQAPLLVAVTEAAPSAQVNALVALGAEVLALPGRPLVDVRALAEELGRREMTNVLVEGGAYALGSFFQARLVDEVMAFVAPRIIGEGFSPIAGWTAQNMPSALTLADLQICRRDCDVVIRGKVRYPAERESED